MSFSLILTYAQLTFAFFAWITLFNDGSILWIPVGMSQLIMILYLLNIYEKKIVDDHYDSSKALIPNWIINVAGFCFLGSSIYSLYLLAQLLPINDKTVTFIPALSLILLFAGNTINILSGEKKL